MASQFELKVKPELSVDAESAAGFDMPAAHSAGVTAETSEEIFVEGRNRLCASIDATNAVLRDLRTFNKDQWILRYPSKEVSTDSSTWPLSILRLDLKLGATQNASALVSSLEKSSVGQLLDERMSRSLKHLQSLRMRIIDTQSKVLVTGDLNAGKSTFINALMRRDLVPTDQQPCTSVFCEIHDAERENNGREEVHLVRDVSSYDAENLSTYTRRSLDELEAIFAEEEDKEDESEPPVLKCFCLNAREVHESLLHNGAVDIALIDAPGLNQDSVKTTALFAREEEIDVIVFVVSAENHFTLSACEFLLNASNEKAYVFVVVNKFDQIRNKEKCRRRVLEQIRQLSPRTYEEAEELVHFVDARAMCETTNDAASSNDQAERFAALESNLHQFLLRRRTKSKLLPAKTYMERLLNDMLFLVQLNESAAKEDLAAARRELSVSRPALAACESNALKAQRIVENEEDKVVSSITQSTEEAISNALETVGQGQSAHASVKLPAYPGLLSLWQYAQDTREALLKSLQAAVNECESKARDFTADAVNRVTHTGEQFLPKDMELPKRVFVPEAMFTKRHENTAFAGLGVSLDIVSVRLTDLFDVPYHFSLVMGGERAKVSSESEEKAVSAPSFTIGLGALSLIGGHALSAKTFAQAFVRLTDILGSRSVRRWAGPVLLLVGAGVMAWVVSDLPNAVPRNVGRSLKKELCSGVGVVQLPGNSPALLRNSSNVFATMHSMRTMREVRKVLRLASWDIQEKFRVAISQRRAEVSKAEAQEKLADAAIEWLTQTAARSAAIQSEVACAL